MWFVEGLPFRSADAGQVPRGLLKLLPAGQRREVLRARVSDIRRRQQRTNRLQGVPARHQHYFDRETGAEARVGVPDVRRQRRRNDRAKRDGRNYRSMAVCYLPTDQFSGSGIADSPACVSVCPNNNFCIR